MSTQRNAAAMIRELEKRSGTPLKAMIEIADRCNEVCVHCYQEQRQKGEMTTEQVKRVIDELAEMGVLMLTISGGEATLRHDCIEILAHARKRRFAVTLFTNGLTMTRELAESLAELALQDVEISLYSRRADVHDWITGVPGSWLKTVNGIRHLVELSVPVTVKAPMMSVNDEDYRAYYDFVRELGAQCKISANLLMPREGDNRAPEALNARHDSLARIVADPILSRGKKPAAASESVESSLDSRVCGACTNLNVEPNGVITPCAVLDADCGNAVEEGVARAYRENENARTIRGLTWRDLHGCRVCDLRSRCSRCFAAARAASGDAMAPYEEACRFAKARYATQQGREVQVLEPKDPRRDRDVGPYRIEASGVLRPIAGDCGEQDAAFAKKYDWVRRERKSGDGGEHARRGTLVQLRRPGQKKSRAERVPASMVRDRLSEGGGR